VLGLASRAFFDILKKGAGKVGAWWKVVPKNVVPDGKQAGHIFTGKPGKLADTLANRQLIQSISNGKPVKVDEFGKAWYVGVDANGRYIYTYTQNGVVKGAGYMNTAVPRFPIPR